MTVESQRIRIPAAYKLRALTALKQIPEPHLPFTDPRFVVAPTLEAALWCFRWEPIANRYTWDIVELVFVGTNPGPVNLLFQVLAPFVVNGSFIECTTDDGDHWRWEFNGFTVKELVLATGG